MTQLIPTDCSGKQSINVVVDMKPDSTDESYEIDTSQDGNVLMHVSQASLSYGFATLGQMLDPDLSELPDHIEDEPRYEHRGVIIDVSQEYFDIGFLKIVVDTLSMMKVNKILLHMIDDDSFPFELKSFSGMAEKTAFSPEETYSLDDVALMVAYSKE